MKTDAKAKFADILDTVQSKDFWREAKALVDLSVPAMNWLCLGVSDSNIPGTNKVYHEMFKTWKLLESMMASDKYAFIPKAVHSTSIIMYCTSIIMSIITALLWDWNCEYKARTVFFKKKAHGPMLEICHQKNSMSVM